MQFLAVFSLFVLLISAVVSRSYHNKASVDKNGNLYAFSRIQRDLRHIGVGGIQKDEAWLRSQGIDPNNIPGTFPTATA